MAWRRNKSSNKLLDDWLARDCFDPGWTIGSLLDDCTLGWTDPGDGGTLDDWPATDSRFV